MSSSPVDIVDDVRIIDKETRNIYQQFYINLIFRLTYRTSFNSLLNCHAKTVNKLVMATCNFHITPCESFLIARYYFKNMFDRKSLKAHSF